MEETTLRRHRHRVLRSDAEHGAAEGDDSEVPRENGDGEDHGDDQPEEDDESFELEPESPRSRYQRYLQSTMEEVSDVVGRYSQWICT